LKHCILMEEKYWNTCAPQNLPFLGFWKISDIKVQMWYNFHQDSIRYNEIFSTRSVPKRGKLPFLTPKWISSKFKSCNDFHCMWYVIWKVFAEFHSIDMYIKSKDLTIFGSALILHTLVLTRFIFLFLKHFRSEKLPQTLLNINEISHSNTS